MFKNFSAAVLSVATLYAGCPTNSGYSSNGTQAVGWQKGATVNIYVSSAFTSTEFNDVQYAFNNWNAGTGSHLNLNVVSGIPASPSGTYVEVAFGDTSPCGAGKIGCTHFNFNGSGYTTDATITLDLSTDGSSAFLELMAHEVGHTYALNECDGCGSNVTIMDGSDITASSPQGPLQCDKSAVETISKGAYGNGGGGSGSGGGSSPPTCPGREVAIWVDPPGEWECQNVSPIILDIKAAGYDLTSAREGVWFDFFGTGQQILVSWTAPESENAFLVLDRNGNGIIDDAKEMFGNITEQPPSDSPNGFIALAEFDKKENGGNEDGIIDARDAVFLKLRLWIDRNHNGFSEPDELFTLPSLGVKAIHLRYRESPFVDSNGNQFRYRAEVAGSSPDDVARTAYDVFLVPANTAADQ